VNFAGTIGGILEIDDTSSAYMLVPKRHMKAFNKLFTL